MPLWRRFWLLGSVIWVVVCLLNAFTIVAFSEGEEAKALQPVILAVAVPAIAYGALWLYFRFRSK
jgi:membrane protein DedA with SNARE-associated domain